MTNNFQFILTVLSIGSVVMPILFGWVIYKLMKIFVTRDEFELRWKAFETVAQTQRQSIIDRQNDILNRILEVTHKMDAVLECASASTARSRRDES